MPTASTLPRTAFAARLQAHADGFKQSPDYLGASLWVRRWRLGAFMMGWSIRNLPTMFSTQHLEMPYLEVMITERCNLRCKHCANLMPLYCAPRDLPMEVLFQEMDLVLASVDRIHVLRVLGGEPLLHRDLGAFLQRYAPNPKIERMELTTNGTIVPKGDTLKRLAHSKIKVVVSPYGKEIAKNATAVQEALKAGGVHFSMLDLSRWLDFGGLLPRQRTREENKRMFARCKPCVTLIDGAIYCCPRAGNGASLGLVPKVPGEYVQVRGSSPAAIRRDLHAFAQLKAISTCDRCDQPGPSIPMAEQLRPDEEMQMG